MDSGEFVRSIVVRTAPHKYQYNYISLSMHELMSTRSPTSLILHCYAVVIAS
jgi:hypothetical protein